MCRKRKKIWHFLFLTYFPLMCLTSEGVQRLSNGTDVEFYGTENPLCGSVQLDGRRAFFSDQFPDHCGLTCEDGNSGRAMSVFSREDSQACRDDFTILQNEECQIGTISNATPIDPRIGILEIGEFINLYIKPSNEWKLASRCANEACSTRYLNKTTGWQDFSLDHCFQLMIDTSDPLLAKAQLKIQCIEQAQLHGLIVRMDISCHVDGIGDFEMCFIFKVVGINVYSSKTFQPSPSCQTSTASPITTLPITSSTVSTNFTTSTDQPTTKNLTNITTTTPTTRNISIMTTLFPTFINTTKLTTIQNTTQQTNTTAILFYTSTEETFFHVYGAILVTAILVVFILVIICLFFYINRRSNLYKFNDAGIQPVVIYLDEGNFASHPSVNNIVNKSFDFDETVQIKVPFGRSSQIKIRTQSATFDNRVKDPLYTEIGDTKTKSLIDLSSSENLKNDVEPEENVHTNSLDRNLYDLAGPQEFRMSARNIVTAPWNDSMQSDANATTNSLESDAGELRRIPSSEDGLSEVVPLDDQADVHVYDNHIKAASLHRKYSASFRVHTTDGADSSDNDDSAFSSDADKSATFTKSPRRTPSLEDRSTSSSDDGSSMYDDDNAPELPEKRSKRSLSSDEGIYMHPKFPPVVAVACDDKLFQYYYVDPKIKGDVVAEAKVEYRRSVPEEVEMIRLPYSQFNYDDRDVNTGNSSCNGFCLLLAQYFIEIDDVSTQSLIEVIPYILQRAENIWNALSLGSTSLDEACFILRNKFSSEFDLENDKEVFWCLDQGVGGSDAFEALLDVYVTLATSGRKQCLVVTFNPDKSCIVMFDECGQQYFVDLHLHFKDNLQDRTRALADMQCGGVLCTCEFAASDIMLDFIVNNMCTEMKADNALGTALPLHKKFYAVL